MPRYPVSSCLTHLFEASVHELNLLPGEARAAGELVELLGPIASSVESQLVHVRSCNSRSGTESLTETGQGL